MIKNRVKNHWYGMENLEELILSKKLIQMDTRKIIFHSIK